MGGWMIDSDFPGGNIIVDRVNGQDVYLRQGRSRCLNPSRRCCDELFPWSARAGSGRAIQRHGVRPGGEKYRNGAGEMAGRQYNSGQNARGRSQA
jgi:hypothetical protein